MGRTIKDVETERVCTGTGNRQTNREEQIKTSNAGNLVSALLEIAWIQLDKNVIELSVSGDFQWGH